jgi:hypothetical protein
MMIVGCVGAAVGVAGVGDGLTACNGVAEVVSVATGSLRCTKTAYLGTLHDAQSILAGVLRQRKTRCCEQSRCECNV